LAITKIKRPRDEEEGGYGFQPCCVINNSASGTVTAQVTCEIILRNDGELVYDDAMSSYPLAPGNTDVYFDEFMPEPNRDYNARFTVDAPGTGDEKDKDFSTTGYDVTPVTIIEPTEWWYMFDPEATFVERANLETSDVQLMCEIRELESGDWLYVDSFFHDFEPGEVINAVFPTFLLEDEVGFIITFYARYRYGNISHPPLEGVFYPIPAVGEYPSELQTLIELGIAADNKTVDIWYNIPQDDEISLTVFDATGSLITDILHGNVDTGEYRLSWDASGLPSGVYFVRLSAAGYSVVEKLVLLR
jgi:hypothetical protein